MSLKIKGHNKEFFTSLPGQNLASGIRLLYKAGHNFIFKISSFIDQTSDSFLWLFCSRMRREERFKHLSCVNTRGSLQDFLCLLAHAAAGDATCP